jgi:hypothetical protein
VEQRDTRQAICWVIAQPVLSEVEGLNPTYDVFVAIATKLPHPVSG